MKTTILEKQPTTTRFRSNFLNPHEDTSLAFNKVYDFLIKPIELSPLMFNHFHWVVNHKENKIIYCFGLRKMLGYDDASLTFVKGEALIHPNFRLLIRNLSDEIFDLFRGEKYRTFSQEGHFCIQFPLQHIDSTFLLVQQNCSILSTDKDYKPVLAYYSFENLGQYTGCPTSIKPRVYFNSGVYSSELEKLAEAQLSKNVGDIILKHINLTAKEKEVLMLLCEEKSMNEITQELNITGETIKVHNKNILHKAQNHLSPKFMTAREVAFFLRDSVAHKTNS